MSLRKKSIASIITALVLISVTATVSSALVQCKDAAIVQAGVVSTREDLTNKVSKYTVRATCPDTTLWSGERTFLLSTDVGDAGYATALTALSTGGTVWLNIEGNADWWSLVTVIYANKL